MTKALSEESKNDILTASVELYVEPHLFHKTGIKAAEHYADYLKEDE